MGDFKVAYEKEEPNNLGIGLSITLTVVFLVGIFIFAYYIFISILSQDLNDKQLMTKPILLKELRKEQRANLNDLKLIDSKKKIIKVPIDVAIDHVIKTYN
tara:strand:+ start:51 stop:353 length:303 start_codon:yes stop_codon:yes gene_type:complete